MKKIVKYIPIILLILHCGLIFFFSAQNEESSTATSDVVLDRVLEVAPEKTSEFNDKQLEKVEKVVRKSAHFVLFLILGIYAYLSADSLNLKKKIVIALVFCLAYGASDEIHQLLIPGRSGEIRDAIIDFSGSTIGVFVVFFIKKKLEKRGRI